MFNQTVQLLLFQVQCLVDPTSLMAVGASRGPFSERVVNLRRRKYDNLPFAYDGCP